MVVVFVTIVLGSALVGVVELVPGARRPVRAMVRWAAFQKYRRDPERAANRAQEWAGDVDADRSATRALVIAVRYAGAQLPAAVRRRDREPITHEFYQVNVRVSKSAERALEERLEAVAATSMTGVGITPEWSDMCTADYIRRMETRPRIEGLRRIKVVYRLAGEGPDLNS